MTIEKIIENKKKNKKFSDKEIEYAINGYVGKEISDEEMTKFIQYIFDNGLTKEETFSLTKIMEKSGIILDLSEFDFTVDKHSSGGVSDSTTIIIVPILASLGLTMLKMSGGGLGFTGGTADKIKCFNNLENEIPFSKAKAILKKCGGAFLTQSNKMVPADKMIYALRDKTNLIESIPLIASSIASKKLASGAKNIILDIKCGNGAFMKNLESAKKLSKTIVDIIKSDNKKACAVITDMNQPLGNFIGDKLEVREALLVLQNKCKNNLYILSIFLASKLYSMAKNIPFEDAEKLVINCIESGDALKKLQEIVEAQKGEFNLPSKKIKAKTLVYKAKTSGFISQIQTKELGLLEKKFSTEVQGFLGFEIKVLLGDKIKKGDALIKIYAEKKINKSNLDNFDKIFEISNNIVNEKLIKEIIE